MTTSLFDRRLLGLLLGLLLAGPARAEPLDFNRDIRPILSENCFYCHGQDGNKREADLRLRAHLWLRAGLRHLKIPRLIADSANESVFMPHRPGRAPMPGRVFFRLWGPAQ